MAESRVFEVDIIVRANGQEDARVSREYTSADALSTDKAAKELIDGFTTTTKERLKPVNDGR